MPRRRLFLLRRRISSGLGAWLPWLVKRGIVMRKYGTFLHVVNPRKLACLSANAVLLPNMRVLASLGKLFVGFMELVECQCFCRFSVFRRRLSAAIQPISQGQRASFASSFGLFRTAKWPLLQPCSAQVSAMKSRFGVQNRPNRTVGRALLALSEAVSQFQTSRLSARMKLFGELFQPQQMQSPALRLDFFCRFGCLAALE